MLWLNVSIQVTFLWKALFTDFTFVRIGFFMHTEPLNSNFSDLSQRAAKAVYWVKSMIFSCFRLRTMYVLDTMAASLKDPLITFHWSTLSSPTRTSVKVSIVTSGYDIIQRTQLVIHIYAKKLTFVCKDGRVLHFSHEPQELRDFILCQISQHQVVLQMLS